MTLKPPLGTEPFEYHPQTRIVYGNGTLSHLGSLARELGGQHVLVVTDPGIVRAGIVEHALDALHAADLEVAVYDQVRENPTTEDVDRCVETAQRFPIDLIVGLGGGSSMDTAKGCNFILTNGGRMQDYWGYGKATRPMLPLIAVPTTAGTGSECQSYALISDAETHRKMACGDPKNAARIAVLDPLLTMTQPREVTACAGFDAIAHAVETYVTTRATPLSLLFSRESFRLTVTSFPKVLEFSEEVEGRAGMLLGAAWAGTAIENSMLGAAHACANPLTARYGIPHGEAVGVMLPHVVRFNGEKADVAERYKDLLRSLESEELEFSLDEPAESLAAILENHLKLAGLPVCLAEIKIPLPEIESLARDAEPQWTGRFNPRPVGYEDFVRLYRAAWGD